MTPTNQKGLSLLQNGKYTEAIDVFLEVLYDDPLDQEAMRNIGIAYTEAGMNHEAIKALDFYLNMWPEDAEALEGLGCAYYRQKAYFKAQEIFRKSLEIHPDSASVFRNLGLVQLSLNQKEEGYENLKRAHMLNLFDYKTAYAFAAACQKTGRNDEAMEILTELLQDHIPKDLEESVRRALEALRKSSRLR